LTKDSIALVVQVRVISKDRLENVCGNINSGMLGEKIRSVVRKYLDV
jgi:hypothetical protein